MVLTQRLDRLDYICNNLSITPSLNEKREIVANIPAELKDDFNFILEILAGKHKLGYTYTYGPLNNVQPTEEQMNMTLREYLAPLWEPLKRNDLSNVVISYYMSKCRVKQYFVEQLVNRKLRLGIGNSLLSKDTTAPMLAKKWDSILEAYGSLYVTEKLDGNRCIAYYDGQQWIYLSRNGKQKLNYNFDMSGLPKEYIYDGEVLSAEQTQNSVQLYNYVKGDSHVKPLYTNLFNKASGIMNRKGIQTGLIYNIFDVQIDELYYKRRALLDTIKMYLKSDTVRILPILWSGDNYKAVDQLCDLVTNCGAEGLMINRPYANYEHKRTNALLKYKKSKTMDMRVSDVFEGTGKYEAALGSMLCVAQLPNGDYISANVGTGISDEQRCQWYVHPNDIIGKIVEVEYFDISQNESVLGTNHYSLRFPRLKRVRTDKNDISIY